MRGPDGAIHIRWRVASGDDFTQWHEPGCIVNATRCAGEEVERAFDSTKTAMIYIGALLKKHDAYAKQDKEKAQAKLRERVKLKKKG